MSKNFSELCALLVEDLLGGLPSRIFSTLQQHGRLSLSEIRQHSQLPRPRSKPREDHVKAGLAVLIQHQLVLYALGEDAIYYEVNLTNAYNLLRLGKVTQIGSDRYGEEGRAVLLNLAFLGQANTEDICAAGQGDPVQKEENLPNGDSSTLGTRGDDHTAAKFQEALSDLCDSRFIVKCRDLDFLPQLEFDEAVERHVFETEFHSNIKGAEKKREYNSALKKRKLDWKDDNEVMLPKQPQDTGAKPKKKQKLNNGKANNVEVKAEPSTNGVRNETVAQYKHSDAEFTPKGTFVRIDCDRFNVTLRNQKLVELAGRALGEPTSQVYASLLNRLETRLRRCHDGANRTEDGEADEARFEPSVTTAQVAEDLYLKVETRTSQSPEAPPQKTKGKDRATINAISEEEHQVNGETVEHSEELSAKEKHRLEVQQHLRLLKEDPRRFISRVGSRGLDDWKVDFRRLSKELIQSEIEKVVMARFGQEGLRILRILHSKGKLDEKQLSSVGLLPPKRLRELLLDMQEAGFIDIQEVPRDYTRHASRTMYFSFYDQERCRKLILDETYKIMARLVERSKLERQRMRPVLEKSERTDVKGREEELLAPTDMQLLRKWLAMEEKILVQLGRLDDLVGILRDFCP